MNNIRTCKFCRKLFQGMSDLCPNCVDELDRKYLQIRNYLDRYPDSISSEIAEGAEVDEKSVLYLVREGRLQLNGDAGGTGVRCLGCGAPVTTGRYCSACRQRIAQQVEQARLKAEPTPTRPAQPKGVKPDDGKSRMHVLRTRDPKDR